MARKNIQDVIRQVNETSVQSTTQEVDRIFNNVTAAQQFIANASNRGVVNLKEESSRAKFLLSLLEAHPNFTWIQYGFPNGDFIGAQRDLDGLFKYHDRKWNAQKKTAIRRIDTFEKVGSELRLKQTKTFERPFNATDRLWYKNAIATPGKGAWSVYVYASNNTPGVDSSIVLEKEGKIQGVIGIGVELKWISFYLDKTYTQPNVLNSKDTSWPLAKLLESNSSNASDASDAVSRRKAGLTFIVNSRNELIAASDLNELTLKVEPGQAPLKLPQLSNTKNVYLTYVNRLIAEKRIRFSEVKGGQDYIYKDKATGQQYFISFAPLKQLDWVVGTVVPASVYYAPIERNNAILGSILLVLIALTSITIVYIADRSLARPIMTLTEAASKIADGNLAVKVKVRGRNEIARLAKAFNKMTRKLRRSQQELEEFNRTLERKVEERTGELNAVLENMVDGLAVVNPQNLIIQFNNALLKMLELSPEDVDGQFTPDVFSAEVADLINQSRANQQEVFNIEIPIYNGHGVGKTTISSICIQDRHQAQQSIYLGSILLLRDITFEKEVDRMKTDFVSSVSHELRTPLTSVLGFAKLIQKKLEEVIFPQVLEEDKKLQRTKRQIRENIEIIVSEGTRLTKLINDVLDIAKMEAGKVEWNMKPMHIEEVINQALAATASLFETKGLTLVRDIAPDLPQTIGDQDRLIQVVINLISNAIKFQDHGEITCQAGVEKETIVVRVIDRGSGIAQEDIPKVFEKFKQVGDTLTSKPQGTGLGLPICKEIIEYHQGILWAESILGKGSTFYFKLPIVAIASDNL